MVIVTDTSGIARSVNPLHIRRILATVAGAALELKSGERIETREPLAALRERADAARHRLGDWT